jgi:hypothetical protein
LHCVDGIPWFDVLLYGWMERCFASEACRERRENEHKASVLKYFVEIADVIVIVICAT